MYDAGQGNTLYRLDAAKGEYSNWQGASEAAIELGRILKQFKPTAAKEEPAASGLAVIGGKSSSATAHSMRPGISNNLPATRCSCSTPPLGICSSIFRARTPAI